MIKNTINGLNFPGGDAFTEQLFSFTENNTKKYQKNLYSIIENLPDDTSDKCATLLSIAVRRFYENTGICIYFTDDINTTRTFDISFIEINKQNNNYYLEKGQFIPVKFVAFTRSKGYCCIFATLQGTYPKGNEKDLLGVPMNAINESKNDTNPRTYYIDTSKEIVIIKEPEYRIYCILKEIMKTKIIYRNGNLAALI